MSEAAVLHVRNLKSQLSPAPLLQRKCACGGSSGITGSCTECQKKTLGGQPLQTKLRISEPGDEYEQEADRVAAQVMRMSNTEKPLVIMRKAAGENTNTAQAPSNVHEVLSGSGQPLDGETRAYFQPRFGHDFGHVRVYSDAAAAHSAREMSARAYTVGSNIVFGAGQFAPQTQDGKRLLAHELTHVIHQRVSNMSEQIIQRAKIGHGTLSWADFKAKPPANKNPKEGAGILSAFDVPGPVVSPDTKKTKKKCKIDGAASVIYEATIAIDSKTFDKLASYMDQDRSWALDRYKGDGSDFCTNKVGKKDAKLFSQCLSDETVERARLLKHEQVHFDITNAVAGNAKTNLAAEAAKVQLNATGCGEDAASEAVLVLYEKPRVDLKTLGSKWQTLKDKVQDDFDTETGHGGKAAVQKAWEGKIQGGLKEYDPSKLPAPTQTLVPQQTKTTPPVARGYGALIKDQVRW